MTYPTVLASNTLNDGAETIVVPNVEAAYCRIMIQPTGAPFFAINTIDFAIGDYTYVLQPEVCTDYTFNTGFAVVENSGSYIGYNLNIPDSKMISDVNINVNITSLDNVDLWYAIKAPWQAVEIQQLASGICTGTADTDLTFDDEGVAVNCASTNNGDDVLPQVALSFADGQDSAGNWVFFLTDINVDGTISTWNSTTITICEQETIPVLAVEQNDFAQFAVYPNPSNGTINLSLSSIDDVQVSLYDIRGRLISSEVHTNNSGTFSKELNFGTVSSGVYLLNVKSGNKTATKKLIIQ